MGLVFHPPVWRATWACARSIAGGRADLFRP